MSDCWFMPRTVADQRAENRLSPNRPSDYETLAAIGVFYKHFDPQDVSDDMEGFIKPLLTELGYHAHDVITISPQVLGEDKFESLGKQHFQEHLHEDDEVRLIIEGSGYFDLRSAEDEWIRVLSKPGDCIVVPAGIYHRFTTDHGLYIKTLRLFKENPKWIAIPREGGEGDRTKARRDYLKWLHAPPVTVAGPADGAAVNGIVSLRFPNVFDHGMSRVLLQLAKDAEKARDAQENNQTAESLSDGELGAVLLYVSGAASPYTHGESWCPDCVAAKPAVLEGLKRLRQRYDERPVYFVEAPVERAAYRGNPHFPYRTHAFLKIKGVPTVFVLTLRDGSAKSILAEEGKLLREKNWYDLVDLRVRTEEPSAEQLSGF